MRRRDAESEFVPEVPGFPSGGRRGKETSILPEMQRRLFRGTTSDPAEYKHEEKNKMRGKNKSMKGYLRKHRRNVIDPQTVCYVTLYWIRGVLIF